MEFDGDDRAPVLTALAALWSHSDLTGPYARNDVDFAEQSLVPVERGLGHEDSPQHLYGWATLPDRHRTSCGSLNGSGGNRLTFYLPIPALERFYAIDYLQDADWHSWTTPLEEWLGEIRRHVFAVAKFQRAAIGPEGAVDLLIDHGPQGAGISERER